MDSADEYHQRLLNFLMHDLNGAAEADDFAQEIFLRLLRLDGIEAIRHPCAFLFRIAANVVSDWCDRYRRRVDGNFPRRIIGQNPKISPLISTR